MSTFVVVGGGVVGLFAAYYLKREGADVTLLEMGGLAHSSRAAAGVLEFTKFELNRINVRGYAQRYLGMVRRGKAAVRSLDLAWLVLYLKMYGREPGEETWSFLKEMAQFSRREYLRLAEEQNDFELREEPVYEVVDDVEKEAEALRRDPLGPRFEIGEIDGARAIVYLDPLIISTDLAAERLAREISGVKVVNKRAVKVGDGAVELEGGKVLRADAVVVAGGWWSRRFGVPVAPLKGYGVRAKTEKRPGRTVADFVGGVFVVPFSRWVKITGRFDLDPHPDAKYLPNVLEAAARWVGKADVVDASVGFRPCTPDGLPVLERRGDVVFATGTCRLGWTYAPAMGRIAADLALGRRRDTPITTRRFS
ncbi:D-proline dehydrogenase [Thermoproteus uzoniensis]|uniref:D-proline dehydrogenase n=1 Tax=Thermoproteus uzoniensis TaxID=184117 RepID=UPI00069A5A9A|nr:D-proline dehydrogenase [Thermoproteus uzoniensis]